VGILAAVWMPLEIGCRLADQRTDFFEPIESRESVFQFARDVRVLHNLAPLSHVMPAIRDGDGLTPTTTRMQKSQDQQRRSRSDWTE